MHWIVRIGIPAYQHELLYELDAAPAEAVA